MKTAVTLGRTARQPYDEHHAPTHTSAQNRAESLSSAPPHNPPTGSPNQEHKDAHSNHGPRRAGRHEEELRP